MPVTAATKYHLKLLNFHRFATTFSTSTAKSILLAIYPTDSQRSSFPILSCVFSGGPVLKVSFFGGHFFEVYITKFKQITTRLNG